MVNSKTLSLGALFATVGSVIAQSAPGFPISNVQATLGVSFGSNVVSPAGELIPRGDTVNPPNLTTPVFNTAGRAILLLVDSDVPRNGSRIELLHWLATNVTLSNSTATNNQTALVVPGNPEAPYRQPSPPVGDIPHAYTFLLFVQPLGFRFPEAFTSVLQSRAPFNTTAFVAAANLSAPLAANYIRVQNLTGTPTTTFPPARPTNGTSNNGTSGPTPFPGAAPALVVGGGALFWSGLAASMVAGVAAFAL